MIQDFFRRFSLAWISVACLSIFAVSVRAADFTVSAPELQYFFTFNGGTTPNPVITLVRGATYIFLINASAIHPFYISPEAGVENNDTYQGTATLRVPTNAVNGAIQYFCTCHAFGNAFQFVDPPNSPAAPTIQIVGLTVGTNLVLTSTGTNNWTTIPEYSTNLSTTNWYALTVQTNRFFNGTNQTICGRPPENAVFLRVRSQLSP